MQRIFQIGLAIFMLTACDPVVDNRGFVHDNVDTEDLIPGVHQRADVARVMGSPSAISHYEDSIWYYIHIRKETSGFLKPEITSQEVTRVTFDENGSLDGIEKLDNLQPKEVQYVTKETPTEGQELGFFEQIVGNIGRFGGGRGRDKGAAARR